MKDITDSTFDSNVIKSDKMVLVDFWAPWCGPCRAMKPAIDSLEDEYGDRIDFFKMNVDDNPMTPSRFNVRSIPTVMLFKDGDLVETRVGLVTRTTLKESVENAIQ